MLCRVKVNDARGWGIGELDGRWGSVGVIEQGFWVAVLVKWIDSLLDLADDYTKII